LTRAAARSTFWNQRFGSKLIAAALLIPVSSGSAKSTSFCRSGVIVRLAAATSPRPSEQRGQELAARPYDGKPTRSVLSQALR
jgi:hypothetical protein